MGAKMDYIKFLGTGGARFVVSKQIRSSGGIWCNFKGKNLLIDPGPGALVRCLSSKPKLDPEDLDAIILTHKHLDHSSDANVLIEAMTGGRVRKEGVVYAPSDAVYSKEPAIHKYLRDSVEKLEILKEQNSYSLGNLDFITSVIHRHSVETYGLKFTLDRGKISFITDTYFFPELINHYKSEVIVINVVLYKHPGYDNVKHLDLEDCKRLITGIKPRVAILTHFGLTMLKNKPWILAEKLTEETGVEVIAAYDGMTLCLEDYLFFNKIQ